MSGFRIRWASRAGCRIQVGAARCAVGCNEEPIHTDVDLRNDSTVVTCDRSSTNNRCMTSLNGELCTNTYDQAMQSENRKIGFFRSVVLAMISAYQRYVSPYKGFCCAYRVHTGRASCSGFGYRAIRMYGIVRGFGLLHERVFRCGVAYRRFAPPLPPRRHARQRGDCDLPCDFHFAAIDGDAIGNVCDVADCFSCDLPRLRRARYRDADKIHLPRKSHRQRNAR